MTCNLQCAVSNSVNSVVPAIHSRYKFAEVRYLRQESSGRGRVETVVVFVPDVWTCMPTALEWEQTRTVYRQLAAVAAGDETTDAGADESQALHLVLNCLCADRLPCYVLLALALCPLPSRKSSC